MNELVGTVSSLWRYPVKSMLGEPLPGPVPVGDDGIDGDRRFGLVDWSTGLVASAKRPQRWQRLLLLQARVVEDGVILVVFPDGRAVLSTDDDLDEALSEFVGEKVALRSSAAPGAELERATPEDVLAAGPDTDAAFAMLSLAAASPPGTFFDFSPLQLITSASLAQAGAFHPAGHVDVVRYRPNILIDTVPGLDGFVENDWAGRRLHIGPHLLIDVVTPSPRCAVPTLRHGDLEPDPDALRVPLRHNFRPVPLDGHGPAPCLGAHATVVAGGVVSPGDEVRLVS